MAPRDTRTDPHRVQAQPGSINGPYMALQLDLIIPLLFAGLVYIIYILHFLGPLTTFWISWHYNMNQGIPLDPVMLILGDSYP